MQTLSSEVVASSNQGGREVVVHVYDLGTEARVRKLNSVSYALGGGLYHTAIEVVGLSDGEISFGMCEEGTGVYRCEARSNEQHSYRESISLGRTEVSAAQLRALLLQLQDEWPGRGYHLITRNCQSFCDALARALLGPAGTTLPGWIRSFAHVCCPEAHHCICTAHSVPPALTHRLCAHLKLPYTVCRGGAGGRALPHARREPQAAAERPALAGGARRHRDAQARRPGAQARPQGRAAPDHVHALGRRAEALVGE